MPRRFHPALPPNMRPRTRANVATNHLALVAPLPLHRRRLRPGQAAAPLYQPLRTPSLSEDWEVTTIVSSLDDPANPMGPANVPRHHTYTFRGNTRYIIREEWEDPEFQRQLREREDEVRAGERRERLRRARVGVRGRGARRAAWRRGGGEERERDLRGRWISRDRWDPDIKRWMKDIEEWALDLAIP